MAVAEQALNGNLNKVRAQDSSVHDWYRLSFHFPHLVKDYLFKVRYRPWKRVLDPFAGYRYDTR